MNEKFLNTSSLRRCEEQVLEATKQSRKWLMPWIASSSPPHGAPSPARGRARRDDGGTLFTVNRNLFTNLFLTPPPLSCYSPSSIGMGSIEQRFFGGNDVQKSDYAVDSHYNWNTHRYSYSHRISWSFRWIRSTVVPPCLYKRSDFRRNSFLKKTPNSSADSDIAPVGGSFFLFSQTPSIIHPMFTTIY